LDLMPSVCILATENHSPLADAKAQEPVSTTEALDIAIGELADRPPNAFTITPAHSTQ
jgi:hypothetical protein